MHKANDGGGDDDDDDSDSFLVSSPLFFYFLGLNPGACPLQSGHPCEVLRSLLATRQRGEGLPLELTNVDRNWSQIHLPFFSSSLPIEMG